LKELKANALRKESKHDFGYDILPSMLGRTAMYAYDYHPGLEKAFDLLFSHSPERNK
jgi:hypothetical protein